MSSMYSAARWKLIESVFDQVADATPKEKIKILANLTDGDAELRREVESLLNHDQNHQSLPLVASNQVVDAGPPRPMRHAPGDTLGELRLLYCLAANSNSEVWCAERLSGVEANCDPRVAVKFLASDAMSERRLQRFEQEARLLARLRHRNVAELLDCGRDADGIPFIVMRFVPGTPFIQFADQQQLDLNERLQLMVQVCDAVAYAHRFLIVHRDLKPSNILVGADRQPVVLDFGISKDVSNHDASPNRAMNLTSTHERPMTPAYASPEQFRGDEISTATDVYALGLILYELLCGHHPYSDVAQPDSPHLADRICNSVPRRPSSMVTEVAEPLQGLVDEREENRRDSRLNAALRAATPSQLRRALRRGADDVVLQAVAKSPEDRYGSIADLRNDLTNLIEHRPINARGAERNLLQASIRQRPFTSIVVASMAVALLVSGISSLFWNRKLEHSEQRIVAAKETLSKQRTSLANVEATLVHQQEKLAGLEATVNHAVQTPSTKNNDRPLALPQVEMLLRDGSLKRSTLARLARTSAAHGDFSTASVLVQGLETQQEGPLDVAVDLAATYRRLGRPTAGLQAFGLAPSQSHLDRIKAQATDRIDLATVLLGLLVDSERTLEASQWLALHLVSPEELELDSALAMTVAEIRRSIGWGEGAQKLVRLIDQHPTKLGASVDGLLELDLLKIKIQDGGNRQQLARLVKTNLQSPVLSVTRAKALIYAAKLDRQQSDWESAEAKLQDVQLSLRQVDLPDHFLALKSIWKMASIADENEDEEAWKRHQKEYWARATALKEFGTRTSIQVAISLLRSPVDHERRDEILRQIKANPLAFEFDPYTHRKILKYEFQAACEKRQWHLAKELIETCCAYETKLWGAESVPNIYARAARSYVLDQLNEVDEALKVKLEIQTMLRKVAAEETQLPASAFLEPAISFAKSDGYQHLHEWVQAYTEQHENPFGVQFNMVVYTIEQAFPTHPSDAAFLATGLVDCLEHADLGAQRMLGLAVRFVTACKAAGELETLNGQVSKLTQSDDPKLRDRGEAWRLLVASRKKLDEETFLATAKAVSELGQDTLTIRKTVDYLAKRQMLDDARKWQGLFNKN